MKTNKYLFSLLLALLFPLALWASGNYVIINQVMYDTPLSEVTGQKGAYNGEFIELYNAGPEEVSLHGWSVLSLSGKNKKETLRINNASIPSGGYLLLASRQGSGNNFVLSDLYQSLANNDYTAIYHGSFVLANTKETLILLNAQNDTIDQVTCGSDTKLKAKNGSNTAGDNCISIHRSNVDFDENGKMIAAKTAWTSGNVSFGTNQLPQEMFGNQTIFSHKPSMDGSSAGGDNYIVTITPLDATKDIKVSKQGISVSPNIRTNTAVQYYDGLGRPNELIAIGATPNKKDLVSTITYSGLHRATQQWLPVEIDSKGQYVDFSSYKDVVNSYYNDARPFTETLYENSALERVTGQKRPGESYVENPSTNVYETNTETDVRIYTVNGNKLKANGTYATHTLYKTTSADEDKKDSVTTYTDKLGNKIMEDRSGSRVYYVYDDLNRLRFVLPHIADKLVAGEFSLDNPVLSKAAYCYKYDDRGNMIYKRLPGCEPQYMVYDMIGQLVLKQDGNQRKKHKWTQCAYDSIGRNLYTCEICTGQDEDDLKELYEDKWAVEHFDGKSVYTMALNTGYANTILGSVGRMYTVNYYDNYDYLDMKKLSGAKDGLQYDGDESDYGKRSDKTIGLLTGTRVYNLSEAGYTVTAYYYDAQGRVIQSRSMRGNADDGFVPDKMVYTEYNFDGSVSKQLTKQGNIREYYHYVYDHAGRTKEVWYKLNNGREIKLSDLSYDEIGHLARNLLCEKGEGNNYSDSIKYAYDMRNMLTETKNKHFSEELYYADHISDVPFAKPCHNGNIAAVSYLQGDSTYTFAFDYDNMNRLTESKFNFKGKVQTSEWFKYDAQGNILQLQRYSGPRQTDDLWMTYQEDGNQLQSVRDDGNGTDRYGSIDYKDWHDNTEDNLADMRYDVNGNLIVDKDRGIRIKYNILNLPDTIQFGYGGHQLVNHYDANGRKYKSVIYTNIDPGMAYYDDIAHYTYDMDSVWWKVTEYNDNIETYYTPEDTTYRVYNSIGYYDSKTNAYYHYIKDHIGNVCAVVNSEADTAIQSTIYFASGVPMMESKGIPYRYYNAYGAQPNQNFGRDEQPYLYNGKEFIEAHGLNEYDSQARRYYATIMRATTIDPMAESNYHISPYAWCGNNPIRHIDEDGQYYFDWNAMVYRSDYTGEEVSYWEVLKNEFIEPRPDRQIGPFRMVFEFGFGNGSQERNFSQDDNFTQQFINDNDRLDELYQSVAKAIFSSDFKSSNEENKTGKCRYSLGSKRLFEKISIKAHDAYNAAGRVFNTISPFGLTVPIGNLAASVMGSFNLTWTFERFDINGDAVVTFQANNEMSAGSAVRPATIGYTDKWRTYAIPAINGAFNSSYNKTGIMRTVTINITWTTTIPNPNKQ